MFNPLNKADEHHFKSLRIPLTNNQKEFDEQVGSLVKIIIDSLNEKEIEKGVEITKAGLKGIDKLEAFLIKHNMDFTQVSGFLRDLQDLRSSGTAHLKGEKYKKIAKKFLIGEKSFQDIFDDILIQSIHILDILEIHFLK
ncbi:hypothetical protein HY745_02485 [Candidatus Desantisbacteria bacterium]|nr:hypothetical protein [Candidatus Desantisbacteria bacterium]